MGMIGKNLFAKREKMETRVKSGALFCHRGPGNQTEVATVLEVQENFLGIPHVRYNVRIRRPGKGEFEDGPRILNMRSFVERFTDQVLEAAE